MAHSSKKDSVRMITFLGMAVMIIAVAVKAVPVWDKLNLMINGYLDGITLAELA